MALLAIAFTLAGGGLMAWAARSTPGLRRTRAERLALFAGLALSAAGIAAAVGA